MEFSEYTLTADHETTLLDLLSEHFRPFRAREVIRNNLVLVNGRIVQKKHFPVQTGDVILINMPTGEAVFPKAEDIPVEILYEDDEVLAVNKPKGMPVSSCPGHYTGTLQNALLHYYQTDFNHQNFQFPHRIDMNTSGCILAAKTKKARRILGAQIADHTCAREYTALLEGVVGQDSATIDIPIGRDIENHTKYSCINCYDEKPCITHYQVLERFEDSTLVHLNLETGRTHQIRAHMEYIGHPIIGDSLYGSTQEAEGLPGQVLHASSIAFFHPVTNERIQVHAPLPEYFEHMLYVRRTE